MRVAPPWLLISLTACAACSGPSSNPDAPPADAGKCGAEAPLYGEYLDWDSSASNFHGVPFATFVIEGDADPLHTDTTAPNGRVEMCEPLGGRALIKVTTGNVMPHMPGHFIADAALFAAGHEFSLRGITSDRVTSFYSEHGLTYDSGKAMLLVQEIGGAASLSLSGATAEATLASADGLAWSPGSSGKYVLFANVTVSGTPMLAGAATGSGAVPMVVGELTMTAVAP
jgi:hypothetical protein